MSQRKKRITNVLNSGVVIEDINVFLPGKGSYVDVPINLANASKDLIKNSHFIKVTEIGSDDMPIWPLISRKSVPIKKDEASSKQEIHMNDSVSLSKEDVNVIKDLAKSIKESLEHLVQKDNHYTPEMFEQMVLAISSKLSSASGSSHSTSSASRSADPIFIPSTVVPDENQAKSNFAAITDVESNKDIESNINVLNSLRKGKKKR